MLAVSPSITTAKDDHRSPTAAAFADIILEDLPDFAADVDGEEKSLDLLEGIDYFDDLFIGIGDGDVLPDLEMEPAEILGVYSESNVEERGNGDGGCKAGDSGSGGRTVKTVRRGKKSKIKDDGKRNNNNGEVKKKAKVDWTPELHRRFVEAVEQLGVEKAVPSRILELMGVRSLTRHNVASHLQKYRSHRKHLLAREADAASWNLRRQAALVAGGGKKPWMAPTLGYPPVTQVHHPHHFRPLHVWGHPTWPTHKRNSLSPPPPPSLAPPPSWPVAPRPPSPSYWHQQPFYPQPIAPPLGYGAPPVPVTPSSNDTVYKSDPSIGVPARISSPHTPLIDLYPSNESVDAAIGDVISKPWLPLPLGLKPPSLDGVMTELHRLGISRVPPLPRS